MDLRTLLKWKIQQMRQDIATKAAKRPLRYVRFKHFLPLNRAGMFIWDPAWTTEISVAATEISVDRAGPILQRK